MAALLSTLLFTGTFTFSDQVEAKGKEEKLKSASTKKELKLQE